MMFFIGFLTARENGFNSVVPPAWLWRIGNTPIVLRPEKDILYSTCNNVCMCVHVCVCMRILCVHA